MSLIRSMTGYGRAEVKDSGRLVVVEIKSVNHRYFEFSARTPRAMGFLDDRLKQFVQSRVSRGKVDVSVSIEGVEQEDADVTVNHALAGGYVEALRELRDAYGLRDDISVAMVAGMNGVLAVQKPPEDEEQIWSMVMPAAERALDAFIAMRQTEGQRLCEDVLSRIGAILEAVGRIEERSPQTVQEYRQKLEERMKEVLADATIDPQRLLTEAALFADKTAVAEETVRLRSHMQQAASMLRSDGAVGRKLDFLVQEMNREINTIGSKAQDISIAQTVVDVKAEIEKIREQIQNME